VGEEEARLYYRRDLTGNQGGFLRSSSKSDEEKQKSQEKRDFHGGKSPV
jgi:hypothetical protein